MTVKQELKEYKAALKFQRKLIRYILKTMSKTSVVVQELEKEMAEKGYTKYLYKKKAAPCRKKNSKK
jgi:hypothetical protein